MDIIQRSFTIFLNKAIFYFLVQRMFHFLVETFAFIINDIFDKSNEQTLLHRNCKANEKEIQEKCSIFSHDLQL